MKQLLMLVFLAAGIYYGYQNSSGTSSSTAANSDAVIARAFEERLESYQVEGSGTVERTLSDDNDGSRHQRFILRLASGHTLMVAHNIDLAPRIPNFAPAIRWRFLVSTNGIRAAASFTGHIMIRRDGTWPAGSNTTAVVTSNDDRR